MWKDSEILYGNIAPDGCRILLKDLPDELHSFRGVSKGFHTVAEAKAALTDPGLVPGTALILLPGFTGEAEDLADYCRSSAECTVDHVTALCSPEPPQVSGCGSYLWFHTDPDLFAVYRNGDMFEYDLETKKVNLDLTEEGFQNRLTGDPSLVYVTEQIAPHTWSILDRYARSFLIEGEEKALLIDTGFGTGDIGKEVRKITGLPFEVLLTHAHWDHAGGLQTLPEAWLFDEDRFLVEAEVSGDAAGKVLHSLEDGQIFDLGGRSVQVLHTPGHSPGSCVVMDYENRMMFAGDTVAEGPVYLFMGHCSLSDFVKSLERLEGQKNRIDTVWTAHRTRKLDPGVITTLKDCVNGILSGAIEGEGTTITRHKDRCRTYHYGGCSVYYK